MSWILTHTGKRFDPINPTPDMIDIEDIAHALSHVNRFNGHTHEPYSVAAHSLHVTSIVLRLNRRRGAATDYQLLLAALLHDASEAYLCDIPSPIKPHLIGYAEIEQRLQTVIAERFGFDPAYYRDPLIKRADLIALATEKRDLMPKHPEPWPCLDGIEPDGGPAFQLDTEAPRRLFLYWFHHFQGQLA